ncbi:NTP transferase domain-containing protein [Streptomyces telluris]|uniref:Molybdenum cofactor guanylyltransferase n=1 Tax=Streptomyces telluris TaxID=2720021 RepID=A0A9X2LMJ3_9ACTN|nr:NTP transferase domain-containing protein [Streptomyces telluris]MCQ8773696.1 molybdenum cofactor guanylyltransferase [Streptomyces telluris]NJP80955.1 molybdenum cofactor guanylyltransferase [Streptomyces telluris]
MTGYDAVVLAGGAARRLGGADKPTLRVGGRTLLDRVLEACADAEETVVVGPRRPTARPVRWAREEPPGGGPLAGLAAGLRQTASATTLVLSADLPFLRAETVRALLAAAATGGPYVEGVLLTDFDGRDQPLVAAYRTEPLRRELALLATEHGGLAGLPLRLLTDELTLGRFAHPTASFDCDTWEDVATARARIRDDGSVLDEWISAAKTELGIDLDVDTTALLDLARDAAHGVARPAAPLTTFLVGYAAGRAGGGPEAVAEATRKAVALAQRWAAEAAAGAAAAGGGAVAASAEDGKAGKPAEDGAAGKPTENGTGAEAAPDGTAGDPAIGRADGKPVDGGAAGNPADRGADGKADGAR